jgi:ketosteroid isomerase-like protein
MRRIQMPILVAAMIISSFALGQMTNGNGDKDEHQASRMEQQLKDLDRQWLEASSNVETDFLKKLFADKMFEVQPGGQIVTGEQMLQSIVVKGKDESTVDEIQVRGIYGDTAILTDRRIIKGAPGTRSRNPDGSYRVMRVYVKMQGSWRAVGAAMTPMTAQ